MDQSLRKLLVSEHETFQHLSQKGVVAPDYSVVVPLVAQKNNMSAREVESILGQYWDIARDAENICAAGHPIHHMDTCELCGALPEDECRWAN